jgi:type I restriction enzyme M protein
VAEEAEQLSLTDIANRADVQVSAVSNWRKRHPDFPSASSTSGQDMFEVDSVAAWLRRRKIPQNRLKPDERPGTSYGDRFLKNLGTANLSEELSPSRDTRSPENGWSKQLWQAMDKLRGTRSPAASLELLLHLVHIRIKQPDLWIDLLDASQWPTIWQALTQVGMPSDPGDLSLQVLRDLAGDADPAVFEAIRILDGIDLGDSHGPDSVSAQLAEKILADLERGMGRSSGQFTPPSVAQCLVELLAPQSSDHVYDPFCGSGELLAAAGTYVSRQKYPAGEWQVYGQTSHEWTLRTSATNLSLHGIKAELREGNALQEDQFPDRKFSRIIANPPFNYSAEIPKNHRWLFGEPPARNANFAWLDHVVSKLTVDGRAAIVMASGAASTQSRSEATIRSAMVSAGVVECVIAMPANLFRFTGIPIMVWVLRSVRSTPRLRDTLFIDATRLGSTADRRQRRLSGDEIGSIVTEYRRWREAGTVAKYSNVDGFSRAVRYEDLRKNDFILAPGRYAAPDAEEFDAVSASAHLLASRDELERLGPKAAGADAAIASLLARLIAEDRSVPVGSTIPLGDACEILSGPGSVPRDDPEPSWTPLVLPRNIRSGLIDSGDMDAVPSATADEMARYRLKPGDIVSARAGTLGRYGLAHGEQAGWLLGPGCIRFRANASADPEYLTYYLGSPDAQRWLMEHTSGSAIRHVNAKTFGEMPVWLPELSDQRRIVDTVKTFDAAASLHGKLAAALEDIRDLSAAILMSRHHD